MVLRMATDAMFPQVEDGGVVVDWIVVGQCHVSNPFLVLITLLSLSNLEATNILNDSIDGARVGKSL